jgi:two-component SAPR family response regulator
MLNEMSIQSQFQQMQQQAKEKSTSKHISTKSMNAFVALTNQKKQSAVVQKIVAQQPG